MRRGLMAMVIGALLGGVGCAARNVWVMDRIIHTSNAIADAVARGVGGEVTAKSSSSNVPLLFGAYEARGTEHPLVWTAADGLLVGGVFGCLIGLFVCRQLRGRKRAG